jgi:hypothetical protein
MKLLVWNMGGAFCYDRFTHERAWEFLREQDPDVALLQEARPPDWAREHWGSFPFASVGPGVAWGSAILSRIRGLHEHQPDQSTPWLRELWGPVVVARLGSDPGLWLASIHSSWRALSPEQLSRCSIEGIRRCREDKIWAVEVIASELERPFAGSPFVFGGDLNSARSFDGRPGFGGNVRLHENLAAGGFHDLRLVSYRDEQQTYFKAGKGPDQLDHVFADAATERRVTACRSMSAPRPRCSRTATTHRSSST